MDTSTLSNAHAVMLAVQLSLGAEVKLLPALGAKYHRVLTLELLLRIILTFVPESTAPARYTSVVQSLVDGTVPTSLSETSVDTSAIERLSVADARKRALRLGLLPLRFPELRDDTPAADTLTEFLIHRAHRIDSESGIQPFILELLEPFLSTSDTVRTFAVSTVLPLLRFNYEYHPNKEETLSLQLVESLDSGSAVNLLLSKAERREEGGDAARDLRGLVGPWMYGYAQSKRRKTDRDSNQSSGLKPVGGGNSCGWQDVNEWLLSLSLRDFALLVEAVEVWDGPEDVDLGGYGDEETLGSDEAQARLRQRYGQAALAAIYATSPTTANDVWSGSCRILSKIARLLGVPIRSSSQKHGGEDLYSVSAHIPPFCDTPRALLFHSELLEPSNVFTMPTAESVGFMDVILLSIRIMNPFGRSVYPRDVAELCLYADEETQLFEFRGVLETMAQMSNPTTNWREARQQLLWLRNWIGVQRPARDERSSPKGIFWRIELHVFEREVLKAMLTAKQYALAVELYANAVGSPPLSREQLEAAVTEAIFVSYDNATNGNKTRGGMQRASETLESFSPHFPESTPFHQIKSLISATHALSFYSLTLQHGVPFQPVSIRVHHDPLSLVEKVLEQNPKAYLQLDNLLVIARHLVGAGLPCIPKEYEGGHNRQSISLEQLSLISERRIISYAVSSALQADDFDTAYSYVLSRLTPPSIISTPSTTDSSTLDDHISWRAAYNAGRHRPAQPEQAARSLQSQISYLSQRMELLSLALVLPPSPEHLSEILAAWRRCDEEMTVLQTRESEEAEKWDTHGEQSRLSSSTTSTIPGGFGPSDRELDALETAEKRARRSHAHGARRKGAYEEAPVGLFDAARGAARALSKNAFPLRGPDAPASSSKPAPAASGARLPEGSHSRSSLDIVGGDETESAEGRVRKRDMVSNMVTGGLVSGIGWVLGAQPVDPNVGSQGSNA